mmetsp:Transcript_133376/g.231668  ORF Transcript_133376/g.231668 Transcript_133376/m.231668 type:complete len:232 (+) Transcript_133376:49-744(+)
MELPPFSPSSKSGSDSESKSKKKPGLSPYSSPGSPAASGDEKKDKDGLAGKPLDSKFGDMGKKMEHFERMNAMNANEDEITKPKKKKAHGRSARAGIIFPVSLTRSVAKQRSGLNFGMNTSVYIAAAVETVITEILSIASNIAKQQKQKTITVRHIALAIQGDEDIKKLIKATIPGGGVVEKIHPALQATQKPQKKAVKKDRLTKANARLLQFAESPNDGMSSKASSSSVA